MQKIVTTALFYANGDLHLGHILEQIQADIFVRAQKMQAISCLFLSGDDTHGTPIMLKAESEEISPLELITHYYTRHQEDRLGFNIAFDNYYTTNSDETREIAYLVYQKIKAKNYIQTKIITQYYDTKREMFLPDRYVKGTCPKCKTANQYGDNCEVCGATYSPTDLIEPYSTLTNTTPELRTSEHLFFKLSEFQEFLTNWLNQDNRLNLEAKNKMQEWLSNLQDWDISRDSPYFGFEIPDCPGKYFYVWLDAPMGYLGTLNNYASKTQQNYLELWNNSQIHHFIGKDILYFHALFWPSVLQAAEIKTPDFIHTHGYVTINGEKMSKSRGTFITAREYLNSGLKPDFLRYYFAAKLNNKIEDIDLALTDFVAKINSELVGKFINIASRSSGFLNKLFNNALADNLEDLDLIYKIQVQQNEIINYYNNLEYAKAIKLIMSLVDEINQYTDEKKPWQLAKDEAMYPELHQVLSVLINAFYLISIYLKPIIPSVVSQIEEFLNLKDLKFTDLNNLLIAKKISPYQHILSRIDEKVVTELFKQNLS